ncbi:MAG: hypothetical protein CEE43_05925 [Promethearchaeota archaeon Loki_b32]|nr:MAG: hypothetical protein CEE43_05925 [Candidatus Lokiarchaeota archaeon Loki_b32]
MSKCPYCKSEVSLEDFFHHSSKITKKGKPKIKLGEFKGVQMKQWLGKTKSVLVYVRMWACPLCDTILGFSEFHL